MEKSGDKGVCLLMSLMPQTVSAKDIQRNYRRVFDFVKKSKKPVVVLTNNRPDVVIINPKELDLLNKRIEELEMADALEALKEYHQAEKDGTLIYANSLADLIDK